MTTKKGKLAGSLLKSIEGDKHPKHGKQPAKAPGKPVSKHPPIPGLEFLGAGYNVFGQYASAKEVQANIFDFTIEGTVDQQLYDESLPQVRGNVENAFTTMPTEIKLFYARPPDVQYKALFQAELAFSVDGSMSSEQKSLSAHVDVDGSYGLFAGEFHARYSSSDTKLATTKFYSATAIIRYFDLSMANFPLHPVSWIRASARKDLNDKSISPDELFAKYGTHYLYAVTIGSKIVYGHTVDTSKTTSSYDVGAELKARYGEEGASVGAGAGADYKAASEQASDAESINFYAEGISDSQLEAMKSVDTTPLAILKEGWHNPTLVDFPEQALQPIWDLCDSDDRKNELKAAFDEYAKTHGSIVGAEADLAPLYLITAPPGGPICYRFSANRNAPVIDGKTWKLANDDGKPWLYVFDEEKPGTVPLYEYACGNQDLQWRYETESWASYLAMYAGAWRKNSGRPVGWVYDGLDPAPSSGSEDVYAYYPVDDGNVPRYLFSTDSSEGRDQGGWRSTARPADDLRLFAQSGVKGFKLPPDSDKATIAVLELRSNVNWRSPAP